MKRRGPIITVVVILLAVGGIYVGSKIWQRSRALDTRIAERRVADAASAGAAFAPVEDWPRWRGPRGDGISRETLPDAWPATGPRQVWAADVGIGYSSPIAAGGRVYLFTLNQGNEALTAFDARTGHIVWSDEADSGWTSDYAGTRATPTIDGDSIYTYGGAGALIRRDLATGKPRWRADVLKLTGAGNLQWGSASSPLVTEGLIYVQGGTGGPIAVAVRKEDGQIAWQSEAHGAGGYAPILRVDVSGMSQLIVFGGEALFGMDPASGRTIWSMPWKTDFKVNASTPVYSDGYLFVTSDYGMGCMMLQVSPVGAKRLWANKEVKSKFQQVILDGGHLYANSEGTLKCLSWPDGAVKWKSERGRPELNEQGSIVRAGSDKLLTMSDGGVASLVRATPAGMQVLGEFQAVEGDHVWAVPLLYGGRLYVKGPKELVCFEVTAAVAATQPTAPPTRATQPVAEK
jgi:outer membrane protein assembly factor BamB